MDKKLKRLTDILLALIALVLFFPIIVALVLLVRIKLGSPVFFTQVRAGQNCRPFRMIKFRSMTNAVGADGKLLPDEMRLTRFGRFLRSSSLDELPELINVLKGDMSLVGPRPLLMDYVPLYSPEQLRRHEAKPGVTGWAQVNGRNSLSWEDRLRMDVWYVDNASMLLDLKILYLTVKTVISRKGISQDGQATMSRFTGTSAAGEKSE